MVQSLVGLLARISVGAIFLYNAYNKVLAPNHTFEAMTRAGIPYPKFLYTAAVAVEFGGALLLVLGARTRWAALFLAAFLIPTTYFFHSDLSSPIHRLQFLKNLAIFGGLLHIALYGGGRWSLDRSE